MGVVMAVAAMAVVVVMAAAAAVVMEEDVEFLGSMRVDAKGTAPMEPMESIYL